MACAEGERPFNDLCHIGTIDLLCLCVFCQSVHHEAFVFVFVARSLQIFDRRSDNVSCIQFWQHSVCVFWWLTACEFVIFVDFCIVQLLRV